MLFFIFFLALSCCVSSKNNPVDTESSQRIFTLQSSPPLQNEVQKNPSENDTEFSTQDIKIYELRTAKFLLELTKSQLSTPDDVKFKYEIDSFLSTLLGSQNALASAKFLSFSQTAKVENLELESRMQSMLQANLVTEEKEHLYAHALLWVSIEALRVGNYTLSQECSKRIMLKPWASVQTQRWAFSTWAMADALLVRPDLNAKARSIPLTFQELQNSQCKALCSLPGWKTLALFDPGSLSPKGYETRIFSRLQFQMADQPRPPWLSKILGVERFKSKVTPVQTTNSNGDAETVNQLAMDAKKLELELKNKTVAFELLIKKARKNWEDNNLLEAQNEASSALHSAKIIGNESLILEASQLLFGRIGFETRPPDEISAQLQALNIEVEPEPDSPLFLWIQWRLALLEYKAKNFEKASQSFKRLSEIEPSISDQSRAKYWQARSEFGAQKYADSYFSYTEVGQLDPLGYYDVLAGGLFTPKRTMASSAAPSPFSEPVRNVIEKWIPLRAGKASPVLSRDFKVTEDPDVTLLDPSATDFSSKVDNSIASGLLLATALRAGMPPSSFDTFVSYLRNNDTAFTRLLRSESLWLKQTHLDNLIRFEPPLQNVVRVSWLLRLIGEYSQAIPYISQFRSKLINQEEDIAFLYFIYFPKPYPREFKLAAHVCGIEQNVAYAVARQESLFQNQVLSQVGAVGVMQLMPNTAERIWSKKDWKGADFIPKRPQESGSNQNYDLNDPLTNISTGSCHLSNLLKKYKGNLALAAAAYNAGETKVDEWIRRRKKHSDGESDEVSFVEWIPYSETQNYVKAVVRNYALMNWIYGTHSTP